MSKLFSICLIVSAVCLLAVLAMQFVAMKALFIL
jgi:hypothetical protein